MKGLTYVEVLIILSLISLILGIVIGSIKIQNYFLISRDLQRLSDLNYLNSALNFYFRNATSIDPDGPYLDNRGIDEATATIFVSVPVEKDVFPATYTQYYFYQSNLNNYQKINGLGWLPINFVDIDYPFISRLPVDPINRANNSNRFYYLYAFRRNPPQYEISAYLESEVFKQGGSSDKVSTDGGNDPQRIEIGDNLELIPLITF